MNATMRQSNRKLYSAVASAVLLSSRRAASAGTPTNSGLLTKPCSAQLKPGKRNSGRQSRTRHAATGNGRPMLALAPQPPKCRRVHSQAAESRACRLCPQLRRRLAVRAADGDSPQQQQGNENSNTSPDSVENRAGNSGATAQQALGGHAGCSRRSCCNRGPVSVASLR